MVKVYSMPDCPWCKKAKAYLNTKGIDYIDINVEKDIAGRKELLEISKEQNIPTININGNIIVGFDKDKIDEYLNL
ncbi:glutaredoxin [Clostridium carboxidivorans P7]|uniref:Glutaredoxin-like protein, YruB-family n=1 Tax=Clostridium carboxidivorans P7 TaxID=536227 RepID=C6Q1A0_9CLOT|nr:MULTISPECIES: glutaredoxin domain-containing protein [Clostridium]AKN30375.1 glutaredoxin [Clostridium carboxidivorans P7]EET84738.1 glutaredoxin-like protein, YruB-family [Clostridium carboxidivorans P7]WPC44349.1 glutaredoxin domain-containing protein [Clostridium sp. JS66]